MSDGIAWIGEHSLTNTEGVPGMRGRIHCPPKLIVHAPGDGDGRQADFASDTASGSALDAALWAAGAVFPSVPDMPEAEVTRHYEEHDEGLPKAVFTAVGSYTGLVVDQAAVEAGTLPLAVLPVAT
ncbi:hypothetical protein [Streptomyces sp. NPDC053427]|uniref:hypothetical protein n=1 Tax=Streptomyces sp. NPDC053427 TaxID=3365701 RepID=UPI0037D63439